jgi:hypothetical protein
VFTLKELTSKNVKRISDGVWKKYFDMRIQLNERPGSKTPFLSWQHLKESIKESFKTDKNMHCISLIQNGNEFSGYFLISSEPSGSRKSHLSIYYNSLDNNAEKSIVNMLSGQIKKYFDRERDGIILFKTINDTFRDIAYKLNGKLGENTIRMNLPPKEANKKEMRKWLKELPAANPDILLKFYTTLPKKLIKEYCALFTFLMEDMPKPNYFNTFIDPKEMYEGEKKNKKSDNVSYRMLAFNGKNELVGMTNIFINKKQPQYPYQYMTGTLPEYRHRGIAKWMKAENFFRITKDFGNRITAIVTETHLNNFGSKRTSKLLGFKYEGCDVLYEIDIDKLP